MREALAAYENELMVFVGRAADQRTLPDGTVHILLTNVRLWPYRSDVALYSIQPIRTDHLWIPAEGSTIERAEMYTKRSGIGRVRQYARRSGSVDYGIQLEDGVSFEQLNRKLWSISEYEGATEAIGLVNSALSRIKKGWPFYGFNKSGEEWRRHYKHQSDRYFLSSVADMGSSLTVKQNGPCRRLRETSRIHGTKRQPARGFA